jgi:hypothetical protein
VEALVKEAEPAVDRHRQAGRTDENDEPSPPRYDWLALTQEATHDSRNRRRFAGQGRLACGSKARTADRFSLGARLKERTGP